METTHVGTMVIETLYQHNADLQPVNNVCRYEKSGWASHAAFRRYGRKQWKHLHPKPYRNGLEIDHHHGMIQRIWFETD